MALNTNPIIDEDLRDAVEEDVRASLIIAIRTHRIFDDAERWAGLA
jgi:hypothetical protein